MYTYAEQYKVWRCLVVGFYINQVALQFLTLARNRRPALELLFGYYLFFCICTPLDFCGKQRSARREYCTTVLLSRFIQCAHQRTDLLTSWPSYPPPGSNGSQIASLWAPASSRQCSVQRPHLQRHRRHLASPSSLDRLPGGLYPPSTGSQPRRSVLPPGSSPVLPRSYSASAERWRTLGSHGQVWVHAL